MTTENNIEEVKLALGGHTLLSKKDFVFDAHSIFVFISI